VSILQTNWPAGFPRQRQPHQAGHEPRRAGDEPVHAGDERRHRGERALDAGEGLGWGPKEAGGRFLVRIHPDEYGLYPADSGKEIGAVCVLKNRKGAAWAPSLG